MKIRIVTLDKYLSAKNGRVFLVNVILIPAVYILHVIVMGIEFAIPTEVVCTQSVIVTIMYPLVRSAEYKQKTIWINQKE